MSAAASRYPARRAAGTRAGTGRPRRANPWAGGAGAARVRWDRLGRIALLGVLVALVYLYVSAGAHMLSTWRQSRHDSAVVRTLEAEHRLLEHQHEGLSGQAALESDARQLGMMHRGEQPYVVSGLPDN